MEEHLLEVLADVNLENSLLRKENSELRAQIEALQSLAQNQRQEFLKERVWRCKFQIDYLKAQQQAAEDELNECPH
jgi:hypothetical protein